MKKFNLFILLLCLIATLSTAVYADDLADVKSSGVLRLGVSPEYAPFAYKDAAGNIDGIDIAFMNEVAKRMGVNIEVWPISFETLVDSLSIGKVDVIGGAFSKTEARASEIELTRAYYQASAAVISLRTTTKPATVTPDNFKGMKIGVQKDSSFEVWARDTLVTGGYISSDNLITYSTITELMDALYRNNISFAIIDEDVYETMYESSGKYQIFYMGFENEKYVFGTRKNSALTEEISKYIKEILSDGTGQAIANPYFSMVYQTVREASIVRPTAAKTEMVVRLPMVPTVTSMPSQSYNIAAASAASYNSQTTTTNGCTNSMTFISDVTAADGTSYRPNQIFTKTWKVYNSGTCTWGTGYTLGIVSSDMEGTPKVVPVIKPGETGEISVDLKVPENKGQFRSSWQLKDPSGTSFGSIVYCSIVSEGDALDQSKNLPVVVDYFYPEKSSAQAGVCQTIFWEIQNADYFEILLDGVIFYRGSELRSSLRICEPLYYGGTHKVSVWAKNDFHETTASFDYTAIVPVTQEDFENWESDPDQFYFDDNDIYFAG